MNIGVIISTPTKEVLSNLQWDWSWLSSIQSFGEKKMIDFNWLHFRFSMVLLSALNMYINHSGTKTWEVKFWLFLLTKKCNLNSWVTVKYKCNVEKKWKYIMRVFLPICIIFQLSSHKSRNIVFFEAH